MAKGEKSKSNMCVESMAWLGIARHGKAWHGMVQDTEGAAATRLN